ncbi:MAG: WD40 repeat domain-containing serine/threonine-protein kinase [Acidobacteriota bacterium]
MSETKSCPECQAPLPSEATGPCPRCLLALGLDTDESTVVRAVAPGKQDAPTEIGPYRLLEVLGEGGFGVVYLAQQERPLKRKVALKVIKLGMDSREVIARFEAEQHALALMSHPNIAKVLDAGTTERGTPYFVMEHVPGPCLTDYCDQNRLDMRQRLELFGRVCEAVQHAHQKGIVHRDLKPSNVLVAVVDGVPRPKVIDFGIAKALDQHRAEQSFFTQRGVVIGTPMYMSPEQADHRTFDIDSTTDVYSLGVILYELMSGALPFEPSRLHGVAYDEMLRVIREEEPPPLGDRLLQSGEQAADIARRRSVDTGTLGRQLRGDLDWITQRALEKDRTRRYASASELAADIDRYLNDEPVSAGPPGLGYRMQKLVRKNRGAFLAAGAIAATLLLGLVSSTVLWLDAREATELARAAQEQEAELRRQSDEATERARSFGLVAVAREALREGRQTVAARLALEARRLMPSLAADRVVRDSLAGLRLIGRPTLDGSAIEDFRFSPDGRRLLIRSDVLTTWDLADGRLQVHGPVEAAAFRPGGDIVAWQREGESSVAGGVRWTTASLRSHGRHVAWSRDGERLVTGSGSGIVQVWPVGSSEPERLFEHATPLLALALSTEGTHVASGAEGGELLLHRLGDESPRALVTTGSDVHELAFTPDGRRLVAFTLDGHCSVWSVDEGELLHRFSVTQEGEETKRLVVGGFTFAMAVSDEHVAAYLDNPGGMRSMVKVHDLQGVETGSFPAPPIGIADMAFAPDGRRMAIAYRGNQVSLHALGGQELRRLWTPAIATKVVFSEDGRRLAAKVARTVAAWELAASEPVLLAEPVEGEMPDALKRLSKSDLIGDDLVMMTKSDGSRLLDSRGQLVRAFDEPAWIAEDGSVFLTEREGTLQVWADDGRRIASLPTVEGVIQHVVSADGGGRVLVQTDQREVHVLGSDGRRLGRHPLPEGRYVPLALSASGRLVGFASASHLTIWDVQTDESWSVEHGQGGLLVSVKFTSDEGWLLSRAASPRKTFALLNVSTRELLHREGVRLQLSPDGKSVAIGTAYPKAGLQLLSLESLEETEISSKMTTGVAWSPDSQAMAFSVTGYEVGAIWTRGDDELTVFRSPEGNLFAFAFSPDGQQLATGSHDGTIRIWDRGGQEVALMRGHDTLVMQLEYSAGGTRLLSVGRDGSTRLWRTSADDIATHLERRLERLPELSVIDRERYAELLPTVE